MASDIKRVGLSFHADGSVDFIKSLKLINAQLQENYQNFKLTQQQYDKNTSASQKLRDKLVYLNDAYDIQSNKIRVLQDGLSVLEQAEKRNEVEIQKKKNAIIQAQTSLERYSNQIEEISKKLKLGTADIEEFASKLKSSSKKVEEAGKKISIVSAGVATIGTIGLNTAMDFESAMSEVQAISGATGSDFDALKEKAKQMGSTTKFTATEAANAMAYMSLAGWKTSDMLNGIEGIMYLAAAAGEDLASVSDIVTDGLTALGYAASDSTKMADIFAKTVTNSNTKVGELGEAMKYTGSIAGALKLDMEDVSLALGLMANAGVKGTQAGTSLRSILQRLSTDTSGARTAMEDLGIQIFDSNGSMRDFGSIIEDMRDKFKGLSDEQKTSYAKTVAGTDAMAGFLAVINSSDKDFNKLSTSLSNTTNAAKDMADIRLDNAKGQMTLIKSQLNDVAISLSEHVLPVIKDVLTWIQNFLSWFSNLSPETQKLILTIAGIIIALGPLLILIGKIGTGISTVITIFAKLQGAFSTVSKGISLFSSMLSGTTLIIIAVVAAVAFLVYEIIKNWDSITSATAAFTEGFIAFFTGINDFLTNIFNADFSQALGPIGEILNGFMANVSNFYESFKSIFIGIIDFIKAVFTGDWKGAWEAVRNIFKGIFDMLFSIAKSPLNLIIGAINTLIGGLNIFIRGLNKIKIPDWVPGVGGKGLNIREIGKISYLAKGGELIRGTAIVGEAGPEMLSSNGKRTKVMPLTNGGGATPVNIIDYDKLLKVILKALSSCKMQLDKDGFVRLVNECLLEVV